MGEEKGVGLKLMQIATNFTKGAACFEIMPDRRYALMKTSRHSHWWEIYDISVGRRLTAFKTMETNSGYIDTYALPAAMILDACRLSFCIYKDEGIGSNVLKTGVSMAGGWVGGYFMAQGCYKMGEFLGGLIGPSHQGTFAVIFGYFGGILGAQYGDYLATKIFESK